VSSNFATVLDTAAIKAKRRLFMTATPRFFTGRVLREAEEADYEVASMDDAEKFGEVFHRLSFAEAIDRGLLTDILRTEEWARELYVATAFNAPRSGRATFRLQGPVLRAWLNGQPITPEASFSAELATGDHVLVFELNKRDLSTKLTLRSDDVSFANE
jgi:hypothetical protein